MPIQWSNCPSKLIADKEDAVIWRLLANERSAVLKMSKMSHSPIETMAYTLLDTLDVPTIQVYESGANWILLEDLNDSTVWRLATVEDMNSEQTGIAVAAWYRVFHDAGARLVRDTSGSPSFLKRQCDALTQESIMETGRRLGMAHLPVWRVAAKHIERLKSAFRTYPETLNYNDFHWTNLALSRDEPVRAVVFDYHLLGIGPAWADVRNVCGSLGPLAREAFLAAYGRVDDSAAVLDRPLSMLYSLQVASMRSRLPEWAGGFLSAVRKGELAFLVSAAVRACR